MDDQLENVENNDLVTLVLYDGSTESTMNTEERILSFNQLTKNFLFYSDQQCCIDYIQSIEPKKKLFFVTLASDAMNILKLIHDLRQIDSVFIFCVNEEENKYYEQLFSDEYSKIIDLYTNFNNLVQSIRENIELVQKETESFSYYHQHQKSIRELSRESALFLWLLLFKDVILDLPHDEQAKNAMIEKLQQHYRNNKKQLKLIQEFSHTYSSRNAIQWYTGQPFIYKTINRALRTEDIEQLYVFRYFIVDLSNRLKYEHRNILEHLDEITVYRGTKLSKQEIEKLSSNIGKLISTNGYLSTSCSRNVALLFAAAANSVMTSANDRQNILFEIHCNLNDLKDTVIFAHIAQFSKVPVEEEVLFDLGATFEILSVDRDTIPLTIKMKAVCEGATLAREYIQFNREEMKELKSPILMYGRLLYDIGKFDECQRYFQNLLNESLNNQEDVASLHVHLGRVYGEKGEFDDELHHYNCALEIMRENGRIKDSAMVLNNIGSLYFDKGEFNKALEYYEKALSIQRKSLPKYHQSTAMSLMNIGFVYHQKFDYDRSIIYHMESLRMKQQILPSNHTLIADGLEHLGNVYWGEKQYNKCLEKYEQTLRMREKLLPRIHIDIAKSLMNLGNVLCDLGRQNDGLESYKNALLIQQELFPQGHPSIALTLLNISSTYTQGRQYGLAREYNQKARDILQQFRFPDDHPYMIGMHHTASEIDRLEHSSTESIEPVLPTTLALPLSFMRSSLFLTCNRSYFHLCFAYFLPLLSFVPFKF